MIRFGLRHRNGKLLLSLSIERRLDQPLPAFTACCSHHGGYTP